MRNVSKLLLFFFLTVAPLLSVWAKPYLKIQQVRTLNFPYIKVEASVSKLAPLLNLTESNFEIYENSWRVNNFQLQSYRHIEESKNIVLVIDASKSLSAKDFKLQLDAVRQFIDRLHETDKVAIISFHQQVQKHCGFTSSRLQIKACLDDVKHSGKKTLLFDAIFEGASLASQIDVNARRFMVIFTDGKDEGSVMNIEDDIRFLEKKNIPTYVIATGDKKNVRKLTRLTNLSGGEIFYSASMNDLNRAYQLLNYILDNTYLLQYVSQAQQTTSITRKVNLEIRFQTKELSDQDSIEFDLPPEVQSSLIKKIWQSEHIVFYLAASIVILILTILLIVALRRQKIQVELPESFLQNAEAFTHANFSFEKNAEKISTPRQSPYQTELTQVNLIDPQKSLLSNAPSAYFIPKNVVESKSKINISVPVSYLAHQNGRLQLSNDSEKNSVAKIIWLDQGYFLYDNLSPNGIYLNGKKLLRPKQLQDLDEIAINGKEFIFRVKK